MTFCATLFLLWDIIFFMNSLGKRSVSFITVNALKCQKVKWWQFILRRLCLPLFIVIPLIPMFLYDFFHNKMNNGLGFSIIIFLALIASNLIMGIFMRHSLVSWITRTRVIPKDEYLWNAYQARHQRNVQL